MNDANVESNEATGFAVNGEIAVGHGAIAGIAVAPDGGTLTITHQGDDSVSLITTAGSAATLTVTDVEEPCAVAMSGQRAYVSSVAAAYDVILALDTDSEYIVASYPVGFGVTDLAVSPNGRHLYVARTGVDGSDVTILDTSTGKKKLISIAAATIGCVRVSPGGRWLYVAANDASTAELVVVDTQHTRVADTVEIGSPIRDIALSPDGATVYVASCGPDFGTVLDVVDARTSRINATYKISAAATLARLTVSRDGERAYLVGDRHVTVLSTTTQDVLGGITVADQPSCALESPDGQRLYIADYAGGVTVLNIAPSAGAAAAMTSDVELTAPSARTYSDLLMLEPTLA